MENSEKNYEKLGLYISAASVLVSIVAGIVYVSICIAKIDTKIDFLERLKTLEVKMEKIEEYYE